MRKCRTIFSTSTIASSTKIPITNDNASNVTTLILKPKLAMPINAGITDNGSATAQIKVARTLRKNKNTTNTASNAPSTSIVIEALYSSLTGCTKLKASVNMTSGCFCLISANTFCTPSPTSISLAPLLRAISMPTTGLPSKNAAERGSAKLSFTAATWFKTILRPSDKLTSILAMSSAEPTVAKVRTGCSLPPILVRPPAASSWVRFNWREISATVASNACSFAGSKLTVI